MKNGFKIQKDLLKCQKYEKRQENCKNWLQKNQKSYRLSH